MRFVFAANVKGSNYKQAKPKKVSRSVQDMLRSIISHYYASISIINTVQYEIYNWLWVLQ